MAPVLRWAGARSAHAASSRQNLRSLKECTEVDELLKSFSSCWCGFSCERVLVILTHTRELSLQDAYTRMTAAGFRTGPWLLTKETLGAKKAFSLPDFELAFSMWQKLEDTIQSLLSVKFVSFWQSVEGSTLTGDVLLKLKPMWEHTAPTQSRRLQPSRACGLGWEQEQTLALLSTHVDLNGDTQELVRELIERDMLKAPLLQNVGLIGGLLWVDSRLAAERLLAGDLPALEHGTPQAAIVRAMLEALAAWDKELTGQNIKHLACFLETLSLHLAKCSNAMFCSMDALVSLIARIPREERRGMVASASATYLVVPSEHDEPAVSRVAEAPRPEGRWFTNRSVSVQSFEAFLACAIQCISLEELVQCVKPVANLSVSAGFQSTFYDWASVQIDGKQSAFTLRDFLRTWLVPLCSPAQVEAWWSKAVDVVNSWSFLLGTLPYAAGSTMGADVAEGPEEPPLAKFVREKGRHEPPLQRKRRQKVLTALLCEYWPKFMVERAGISTWLFMSKQTKPSWKTLGIVGRETHTLSVGAVQINDALQAEHELVRVLAEHPTMHKSKTKEEFALLQDWVHK